MIDSPTEIFTEIEIRKNLKYGRFQTLFRISVKFWNFDKMFDAYFFANIYAHAKCRRLKFWLQGIFLMRNKMHLKSTSL